MDENGIVSFADDLEGTAANPGNNEADIDEALVDARITVVNGVGAGSQIAVEAQPQSDGSIDFTINSDTADSVVPVVFSDTEDDDTLELDANNQPTESFGIGGQKTWVPEEADSGVIDTDTGTAGTDQAITAVDKTEDYIVTDDALYEYDANDVFYVSDDSTFVDAEDQVTMAEFEAQLSVGDALDETTAYQKNDALSSTFRLVDSAPDAPDAVDAALEDDGRAVEVSFDGSTTPSVDNYRVYRTQLTNAEQEALETGNAAADAALLATIEADEDRYSVVGTVADNNPTPNEFEFVDNTTEFGETYVYSVAAVDDGEESTRTDDGAFVTTLDSERETVAPTLVDTDLTDTNTPVVLDAGDTDDDVVADGDVLETTGDEIVIRFSETMDTTALAAGNVIRVTDAQGEVFAITMATVDSAADGEALFAWDDYTPSGTTTAIEDGELTLTLLDSPVKVAGPTPAAGAGTAEVPADITAFTANALQDLAGNDADLAGSADRTIDNEL